LRKIVNIIAMTVVLFFAAVWLAISWKLWRFTPTPSQTKLVLSDPVITTAGFLATTVGAGTAAVLGITISKVDGAANGTLSARVNNAVSDSPLLVAGILVYFFTGVVTLAVWLLNPNEAPDLTKTFALGLLGWAGGAFSGVFKAT
jgi:uncharacterized membrane protein